MRAPGQPLARAWARRRRSHLERAVTAHQRQFLSARTPTARSFRSRSPTAISRLGSGAASPVSSPSSRCIKRPARGQDAQLRRAANLHARATHTVAAAPAALKLSAACSAVTQRDRARTSGRQPALVGGPIGEHRGEVVAWWPALPAGGTPLRARAVRGPRQRGEQFLHAHRAKNLARIEAAAPRGRSRAYGSSRCAQQPRPWLATPRQRRGRADLVVAIDGTQVGEPGAAERSRTRAHHG